MDEAEFYITLPSNAASSGSRTSNFVTRLPERLNVAGYECGLAEIIYPQTISANAEKLHYTIYEKNGNETHFEVVDGKYTSIDELMARLAKARRKREAVDESKHLEMANKQFQSKDSAHVTETSMTAQTPLATFVYSKTVRRVYIDLDETRVEKIQLSDQLAYVLGFRHTVLYGSAFGDYAHDLQNTTSNVYVLCDLIYPQIVGNKRQQLLRVIPTMTGAPGGMMKQTFDHIFYFPLLNTTIDSIQITLANELGSEIPYNFGAVVVVLKLRPIYRA